MATARLTPADGSSGLRFSLRGMMFTFVLGVSIGLAYGRLPGSGVVSGLFAGFTTWFVLGIGERLRRDWRKLASASEAPSAARWGLWLRLNLSIAILILLAISLVIHVYCWRGTLLGVAWNGRPAATAIANVIYFLAIMVSYWSPPRGGLLPSRWMSIMKSVVDCGLLGLAAVWGAYAFVEYVAILQLVHIAIRNVQLYQPARWLGQPLYQVDIHSPDTEPLSQKLAVAFLLLTIWTAANALLLLWWRKGWRVRLPLFAVSGITLTISGALTLSLWSTGIATLSPFFSEALQPIATSTQWEFALLMVTLGAAIALVSTVRSVTASSQPQADEYRQKPLLHEWSLVILLIPLAVFLQIGGDLWQMFVAQFSPTISWLDDPWLFVQAFWRCCQEYVLGRTDQMMGVAAVVLLARFLWRRWRGWHDDEAVWLVQPGEFVALWLIAALTIAIAIPLVIVGAFALAIGSIPT